MSDRGRTAAEDDALGCYEEGTITRVDPPTKEGGSWSITYDGWGCGVPSGDVEPKVGDHFRAYGRFGRPMHGQALNGVVLWYKTPEVMAAEHEAWCADLKAKRLAEFEAARERLDAEYDALPPVLKKRIDRFRAANPDFRVEYESYEMFVCSQAALLAGWAPSVEAIDEWNTLPYAEQMQAVPGWDDGHSGNTHGCAVALAKTMLTTTERAAVMPGAMSPIVGTTDYSEASRA